MRIPLRTLLSSTPPVYGRWVSRNSRLLLLFVLSGLFQVVLDVCLGFLCHISGLEVVPYLVKSCRKYKQIRGCENDWAVSCNRHATFRQLQGGRECNVITCCMKASRALVTAGLRSPGCSSPVSKSARSASRAKYVLSPPFSGLRDMVRLWPCLKTAAYNRVAA